MIDMKLAPTGALLASFGLARFRSAASAHAGVASPWFNFV
jgi:hypothetical protein